MYEQVEKLDGNLLFFRPPGSVTGRGGRPAMRTVRELSPFCPPNRLVGASLSHEASRPQLFLLRPGSQTQCGPSTSKTDESELSCLPAESSTTTGEVVQARRGLTGTRRPGKAGAGLAATDTDKDNSSDIYRGVRTGARGCSSRLGA